MHERNTMDEEEEHSIELENNEESQGGHRHITYCAQEHDMENGESEHYGCERVKRIGVFFGG